MGMFDWVEYPPQPCWKCGADVKGWQSKDGECLMNIVQPHEVKRFYSVCMPPCLAWNQYVVRLKVVEYVVEPDARDVTES